MMNQNRSLRIRQWAMGAAFCTVALARAGGATKAPDRPAILGHRGALMLAPENTLAAFGMCLATGTDIELDVWPTKDGELVVIHDDRVDRTTNGKGRVADLTLAEIKRLDAGSWFHEDFAGERIPTLREALRHVVANERRATVVAINLKPVNEVVVSGVLGAIRETNLYKRSFLFDLSLENARLFKKREPRVRCAASPRNPAEIRDALALDIIDVIWAGPQSKATIDLVHKAGKVIYITIVNNAAQWLRLKADGADGICTNHPVRMKEAAWPPPAKRMWDHYLEPAKRPHYQFKAAPPPTPAP
jgi:glycerophosphoryl diester phosphodiesterase